MNGQAVAAQAIGHAGLRELASEHGGPRPRGTAGAARAAKQAEEHQPDAREPAARPQHP